MLSQHPTWNQSGATEATKMQTLNPSPTQISFTNSHWPPAQDHNRKQIDFML
jgi:hypothetical protein